MPTLTYPVRELCTRVAAAMVDAGNSTEHKFGRKYDFAHGAPPRYVWVPVGGREQVDTHSPKVDEHRMLFAFREHFHVGCWGRSYAECWAMANNLAKAVNADTFVDARMVRTTWERASEAWNQKGELLVVEMSLAVPLIDAWCEPAEEPTYEDVPTVLPTGIEADVQQTDDPDDIGETAVVINTASDD